MPETASIKKLITSYPMLFGVLMSIVIFGSIIVIETWFPWIDEALRGNKRLAQAILFTTIYFVAYVYGLRRWRRIGAFGPTIFALFLLHVLGVLLYSTHVRPILVWQWPIVGLLEYYGAAFFLEWSTRRLRAGGPDAKS